jgi:hypothetical protein
MGHANDVVEVLGGPRRLELGPLHPHLLLGRFICLEN